MWLLLLGLMVMHKLDTELAQFHAGISMMAFIASSGLSIYQNTLILVQTLSSCRSHYQESFLRRSTSWLRCRATGRTTLNMHVWCLSDRDILRSKLWAVSIGKKLRFRWRINGETLHVITFFSEMQAVLHSDRLLLGTRAACTYNTCITFLKSRLMVQSWNSRNAGSQRAGHQD